MQPPVKSSMERKEEVCCNKVMQSMHGDLSYCRGWRVCSLYRKNNL